MKRIQVDRNTMLAALKVAALAGKQTEDNKPSHVLLRASGGTCLVFCTDYASSAAMTIECSTHGFMRIAAPMKEMLAVVEAFPSGLLVIESVGAAGPSYRMYPDGSPRDRYSFVPLTEVHQFEERIDSVDLDLAPADRDELRRVLSSCKTAAAADETRPHLCSVLLEPSESGLVAVATDGHRMHVAQSSVRMLERPVILPVKFVSALLRLLALPGEVQVAFRDAWFFVVVGAARLCIKAVDMEYPPWRKVLPAEVPGVMVRASDLAAAMARVGLVTAKGSGARIVLRRGAPDVLLVTGGTGDRSMSAEVMVTDMDRSPAIDTMVNARYLAHAIAAVAQGQEDLIVQSGGALEPLLVRAVDGTAQAIVMPMSQPKAESAP